MRPRATMPVVFRALAPMTGDVGDRTLPPKAEAGWAKRGYDVVQPLVSMVTSMRKQGRCLILSSAAWENNREHHADGGEGGGQAQSGPAAH